jgi:hypothetical protein
MNYLNIFALWLKEYVIVESAVITSLVCLSYFFICLVTTSLCANGAVRALEMGLKHRAYKNKT